MAPANCTGKELSAFLGFGGYYRDVFPGFAEFTANLNEVKNKCVITWTEDMINNLILIF